MRLLDRYILKNVLSWTAQALMVLLFIFVFVSLIREFRTLLVDSNAGVWLLLKFFLTAIPLSLGVALPLSFLVGNLVTFGQLSTSSEITSMRMAGLSLKRIAFPTLIVGVLVSVFCIFVNSNWVPAAKRYKDQLLYDAIKTKPEKLLDGQLNETDLYFNVARADGNILHNINWTQYHPENKEFTRRQAARGELRFNDETQQIAMDLYQVYTEQERQGRVVERGWAEFVGPLHLRNPKSTGDIRRGKLSNQQIASLLKEGFFQGDDRIKYQDEIDMRNAISWASLALVFLGVPLSLTSARRGNSKGFILSIVIGLLYFILIEVVKSLGVDTGYFRSFCFWVPNLFCVTFGYHLLNKKEAL